MTDDNLRRAILARVAGLRPGTTCCPSRVARDLADDWRVLMPRLRAQAFGLARAGLIRVTQKGRDVAEDASGPIRLGPNARTHSEEQT
ncbi:DUF3253 domain-containing protein [Paracoccus stylophorae]|uniref:DUF3253 domain-containing protein n=1 Tax=Paracoccus stylophorae TaxID=659350 RepID=A0ABY7ST69_9RHOB|nr:DUF3253 domain-containing protein [Paracoccus stylophorae]WCR10076.1 DUF3253 domain-containing protein [Paracoccus stylophorae]